MKLKTRTNQPVYYKLPVSSNIQSLSDDLLNSLKVGDVVQKKTGNQKHCYIVTYKEEKKGICLTYVDCGYMETISYDYTDGHWVFNSKDVQETQEKLVSGTNIKTIGGQSILGSGNLAISGGTQLYKHKLTCTYYDELDDENKYLGFILITLSPDLMDNETSTLKQFISGKYDYIEEAEIVNHTFEEDNVNLRKIIVGMWAGAEDISLGETIDFAIFYLMEASSALTKLASSSLGDGVTIESDIVSLL